MALSKQQLEELIRALPSRPLQSTLFNVANAYALAADSCWSSTRSTGNGDFAAPAIMCQSFAVELLLKFFLAVDHPTARTAKELKSAGVKLKCHKYSELFGQLRPTTKDRLAAEYSRASGQQTDATGFRAALVAQGDDPFVYWRYVYETDGVSHFDKQAFNLLTDALGAVAQEVRRREVTA